MPSRLTFEDAALRRLVSDRKAGAKHRAEAIRKMQQASTKLLRRLCSRCEPALVREAASQRLAAELAKQRPVPAAQGAHADKDGLAELLREVEADGAKPAEGKVWDDRALTVPKPPGDWVETDLPRVRGDNAPLPPSAEPTKEQQVAENDRLLRVSWEATSQRPDYTAVPERKPQMLSANFDRTRESVPIASAKPEDGAVATRKEFARLEMAGRLNYLSIAEQMRLLGWKDFDEP